SPSMGFSCAVSGMKMPPAVFASGSTRRIRTRSCNGRSFIDGLLGPEFNEGVGTVGWRVTTRYHQIGWLLLQYNQKITLSFTSLAQNEEIASEVVLNQSVK